MSTGGRITRESEEQDSFSFMIDATHRKRRKRSGLVGGGVRFGVNLLAVFHFFVPQSHSQFLRGLLTHPRTPALFGFYIYFSLLFIFFLTSPIACPKNRVILNELNVFNNLNFLLILSGRQRERKREVEERGALLLRAA